MPLLGLCFSFATALSELALSLSLSSVVSSVVVWRLAHIVTTSLTILSPIITTSLQIIRRCVRVGATVLQRACI